MILFRVLLALAAIAVAAGDAPAAPRVVVLDLDDTIQPASLRYVERGLREAANRDAALVVIELDTPGGLLDSTRQMVSEILASPVPVAVYVTPSGSRAASAGFFLLLAADVAAMSPGSNTGAAHPISIGGGDDRERRDEGTLADPARAKAAEDAAAFARSLAERRHRSATEAARAVTEAAAFSAEEARDRNLIDLIATDREALLRALDGRTVTRFDGRAQTLRLAGAQVVVLDRTLAERVLGVIASPTVAYLLLMLGAIGVLIELTSPGLVVPGIAGVLASLLGLYGLALLPISLIGGLLIAAGFALLAAEVFVTSYGALAVGGIASFVVGSLMLVDAPVPELSIGPAVVVPVAVVLGVVIAFLSVRAAGSRRLRVQSGLEAMVGEHGRVVVAIDPGLAGKVFVHGEYWTATALEPVPTGATVRIDAVDGLRLHVSPLPAAAARGGVP